jgi:hypothetical protein
MMHRLRIGEEEQRADEVFVEIHERRARSLNANTATLPNPKAKTL